MVHLASFRGDFAIGSGAFKPAIFLFAALSNLGWKTWAASSSLVISVGCFFIFLGMVTL